MELKEVNTPALEQAFLNLPKTLYRNDPNWVMPLDADIQNTFNPAHNISFECGEAIRWILQHNGKTVGRIAAFYQRNTMHDLKEGGMGFFECENNYDYAKMLFDTAAEWLRQKGISIVEAPINFGERDSFWGLMVSGFQNPSYRENYNPPYYKDFFDAYGFEKEIEQSTSEITKGEFNYERFSKLASRVLGNPRYHFEYMNRNNIEKYANDFVSIYNQAWAGREHFTPLTYDKLIGRMKEMLPIVPDDLNWFVYADGEPAGFYINVFDVNQVFKHINGKLDWLGKLKFLWFRPKINRVRGIVFGVIPKFHNLGLEVGMIMKFHEVVHSKKYDRIKAAELAWVGDFNPKMLSMFDSMGAKTTKIHYTYKLKL